MFGFPSVPLATITPYSNVQSWSLAQRSSAHARNGYPTVCLCVYLANIEHLQYVCLPVVDRLCVGSGHQFQSELKCSALYGLFTHTHTHTANPSTLPAVPSTHRAPSVQSTSGTLTTKLPCQNSDCEGLQSQHWKESDNLSHTPLGPAEKPFRFLNGIRTRRKLKAISLCSGGNRAWSAILRGYETQRHTWGSPEQAWKQVHTKKKKILLKWSIFLASAHGRISSFLAMGGFGEATKT